MKMIAILSLYANWLDCNLKTLGEKYVTRTIIKPLG
jgi:hypothetical protein